MIEAVNSVISNAQVLKAASGPVSSAKPVDVQVDVAEAAVGAPPSAPFISPYIAINNDYNKAVIQIRNRDTGDVVREFPSESALRARQAAAAAAEGRPEGPSQHIFKTERAESLSESVTQTQAINIEKQNTLSTPSVSPQVSSGNSSAPAPSVSGQAVAASSALIASSQVGQAQSTVSVTA